MAAQFTKTTKLLLAVLAVIIIVGILVIFIIPRIGNSPAQTTSAGSITITSSKTENASSQTTQEKSEYSKYSFISENKDQLLNVLARSYSQELTQVMIIYWKLSN